MMWSPQALMELLSKRPEAPRPRPEMVLPKQNAEPTTPDSMEAQRKGYFLARLGLVDSYAPEMELGDNEYIDKAEEMIFRANQLNRRAAAARVGRPVDFKGTPPPLNVQRLEGKRGRGALPVAQPKSMPTGNGNLSKFINAIAGKESGGSYSARNSDSGAMGKYQIMPANIAGPGGWDMEALGRNITAEQFMSSPKLQEAIARHKLAQYYNKYGARGAASAWYSGDPNKWRNNSPQGGYPSIYAYVMSILNAMGR